MMACVAYALWLSVVLDSMVSKQVMTFLSFMAAIGRAFSTSTVAFGGEIGGVLRILSVHQELRLSRLLILRGMQALSVLPRLCLQYVP